MKKTTFEHLAVERRNLLLKLISFSWVKKSIIIETIALLFVILFLYTGISKLQDFSVFEEQLSESPILKPISILVAWGLPFIEFLISILLFIPRYRLIGLYITFILMVLFTCYVGALLTFSTELPCSCGGILEALSWPAHLFLNLALIGLALIGIRLARSIKNSNNSL